MNFGFQVEYGKVRYIQIPELKPCRFAPSLWKVDVMGKRVLLGVNAYIRGCSRPRAE
jgi:uncharacterized protein (DUF39 family)